MTTAMITAAVKALRDTTDYSVSKIMGKIFEMYEVSIPSKLPMFVEKILEEYDKEKRGPKRKINEIASRKRMAKKSKIGNKQNS